MADANLQDVVGSANSLAVRHNPHTGVNVDEIRILIYVSRT